MSPSPSSTTNISGSIASELRRLLAAVLVMAILPTALVVGFFEFTAWRLGATWTAAEVANELLARDRVVYAAPPQQTALVKEDIIRRIKPEILFGGTSRVSQFRSAFFRPYTFFNHANALIAWKQYSDLIDRMPKGSEPRVFLFTFDFYLFMQKAVDLYYHEWFAPEARGLHAHLANLKVLGAALARRPDLLIRPARDPISGAIAIGVPVIIDGAGFRRDGSVQYGYYFRDTYPLSMHDMTAGGQPGPPPYFFQEHLDGALLQDFAAFARKARERGITLVAVTVPMWLPSVEQFDREPRLGVWHEFTSPKMREFLDSLGVYFHDCSRLPKYTTDNLYWIDPYHPTEPADLACVVSMLEDEKLRALFPKISLQRLRDKLAEDATHTEHIDLFKFEF